jgi:hypothetical protein
MVVVVRSIIVIVGLETAVGLALGILENIIRILQTLGIRLRLGSIWSMGKCMGMGVKGVRMVPKSFRGRGEGGWEMLGICKGKLKN